MVGPHPAEIMAMTRRIETLERECQRLREVIAQKADNEASLLQQNRSLHRDLVALRGEHDPW